MRYGSGYWPSPSPENPLVMIRCFDDDLVQSSCNPGGQCTCTGRGCDSTCLCADGHTGRACAECAEGYVSRGRSCVPCSAPSASILPSLFLMTVFGLFLLRMITLAVDRAKRRPSAAASILTLYAQVHRQQAKQRLKLTAFCACFSHVHTQSMGMLLNAGSLWTPVMKSFLVTVNGAANLDVIAAIQCSSPSFKFEQRFYLSLSAPGFLLVPSALVWAMGLCVYFLKDCRRPGSSVCGCCTASRATAESESDGVVPTSFYSIGDMPAALFAPENEHEVPFEAPAIKTRDGACASLEDVTDRTIWFFLFGLNALFFPLLQTVMSVARCETDQGTGIAYLVAAPELECGGSTVSRLRALAGVFGVVYGAGIPGIFLAVLLRTRNSLVASDPRTMLRYGFLYLPYRDALHGAHMIGVTGQVAFAASAFLMPYRTVAVPLCLFSSLMILLLVHQQLHPFHSTSDNRLFAACMISVVIAYLSSLMPAAPGVLAPQEVTLAWLVVGSVVFVGLSSICLYCPIAKNIGRFFT
jgi:hypothetical protein